MKFESPEEFVEYYQEVFNDSYEKLRNMRQVENVDADLEALVAWLSLFNQEFPDFNMKFLNEWYDHFTFTHKNENVSIGSTVKETRWTNCRLEWHIYPELLKSKEERSSYLASTCPFELQVLTTFYGSKEDFDAGTNGRFSFG